MKSKLGICQLLTSCFFFTALFFSGGRKSGEGGGGRGEGREEKRLSLSTPYNYKFSGWLRQKFCRHFLCPHAFNINT